MTVTEPTAGILDELLDVAKAIGLMRPDGSIDTSWFESPLGHIGRVFGDEAQRQALLDLLDAVLPTPPGVAPAGEHWYPLLGPLVGGAAAAHANAYLTIEPKLGETLVGLIGSLSATTGGANPIAGSLSLRAPLLRATPTNVDVIAGSADHPVSIEARVATNLSVAGGDPIGLAAVRVSFGLATSGVSTHIVLEQLDLADGTSTQPEVVLDPSDLGAEATKVVVGLLRHRLEEAATDAGLPAAVILLARQLPILLGLDPTVPSIDAVPFLDGPAALQGWFAHLTEGGATAPVVAWLDHVADLLGVAAAPRGDGTDAAPWTIAVPITAGLVLELWCARINAGESATPVLRVGASVVGGAVASAVVEGRATLFEAPLSGTGATRVLPDADVRVRAPADQAAFLVGPNPGDPVRVRSLVGGFRWNGNDVAPVLELLDVDFEGVHHERIDLHNGQSIANAGLAILQAQIAAALGGSPRAAALAALVGLDDPPGAAGWPTASRASFAAFAANPLTEIARVHRTVLGDVAHPWSAMLAALATVVGVPTNPNVVTGAGTADDPWLVGITTSGALSLQLAAWNTGAPGGDEELRIGLRLGADQGAWHAAASLELLSFDLPASGAAAIRFVGGLHAMVRISSLPDAFEAAGVAISASAIRLGLDWTAGSSMTGGAVVQTVTVTSGSTTVVVPALHFPPGPSTPTNPLAGFGVNDADAQELARLLLGRAAIAWGGMSGHTVAGLLGLHRELAGIPAAAPLLTDGAATPFTNPLAALRALLHSVLTAVDSEGVPVAASWLTWLAALIGDALPPALDRLPDVSIGGAGTYDDPWALPIADGTDALLWLEPGPPGAWATAAAGALGTASSSRALVDALTRLAPSHAGVAEAMAGRSRAALAEGIEALTAYLSSSDGVVPIASQVPTTPGWTAGTAVAVAHHRAPGDAGVIAQVLGQLNLWAHGAVLLVGPRFSDAGEWGALLAAAGAGPPAHVDFRTPGLDPAGVDLTGLPANGWYTADLRDDGGTDPAPIVAQIERVVEQIRALHGGQPVVIVAHSTAAVAARAYAAGAAAGRVAGLVAITAPLLGASLTPVVDPTVADA
ncbi:MAG: large repetitive protein, partial [Acidimicrobiaceae bacterium]